MHPGQQAIYASDARFKVVAAGRRFGKTVLAAMLCILAGLQNTNEKGYTLLTDAEVLYVAPTFEQAKAIFWPVLKEFCRPLDCIFHENTGVCTLPNGVRIRLKGMDNPDAARGLKLRFAVLDEYADMPETAWSEIIEPALMDVEGGALFIGTPKGRNHFYKLFQSALMQVPGWEDWEAFNFTSKDNPTINAAEVGRMAARYANGSEDLFKQEIEASFVSKGGKIFHVDHFPIDKNEPKEGHYEIAVDLAGFSKPQGSRNSDVRKLDDTAIAIVKIQPNGHWWVKEIQHGKWDPRETALRILKAALDNQCPRVGIEKGALANAVAPWIEEYQRQFNRYVQTIPLTHGNQRKWDRIQWALQGRAQKGQIKLNKGAWNDAFLEQAVEFPSRLAHDDLIDALAYIDQLAEPIYFDMSQLPGEYEPLDEVSGF